MKRVQTIGISGLKSSYSKKYKPKERLDVSCFNNQGQQGNFICEDMAEALKILDKIVTESGGSMYIIDLFRNWSVQEASRNQYLSGKKRAFVAPPGGSFHNAGRAVDISVKELSYSGIEKDDWLQKFWDQAKPLGLLPIIKIPNLGTSECWHFDFPGEDWKEAYEKLSYPEVAKCATLDIGAWDPSEDPAKVDRMFLQSQLIRLGHYEIGKVDGVIGSKTQRVLDQLGNPTANDLATKS